MSDDVIHLAGCGKYEDEWNRCTCGALSASPTPPVNTEARTGATTRGGVLLDAKELIEGDRNVSYGSPTENFTNIAALWNVQFGHKLKDGEAFSPEDTALAMIHVKMARIIAQPKRDNWTDIAGYAACGYEASEEAA